MFLIVALCIFIGTLGFVDRRILNNILGWVILNMCYFASECNVRCIFYVNILKSKIIYFIKCPKKDIFVAHIKNSDDNAIHDNTIQYYTGLPSEHSKNVSIAFYGHMKNCRSTFTNTVYMQRLDEIPDSRPSYNISKMQTYAINIRILENNVQWASYPVSLTIKHNNTIYNYLVEGNILFDKKFVDYWLKTYHSVSLKENQEYDVHFVDKDVNEITLTPNNYIKLTDSDYIMLNKNSPPIDYEPVVL